MDDFNDLLKLYRKYIFYMFITWLVWVFLAIKLEMGFIVVFLLPSGILIFANYIFYKAWDEEYKDHKKDIIKTLGISNIYAVKSYLKHPLFFINFGMVFTISGFLIVMRPGYILSYFYIAWSVIFFIMPAILIGRKIYILLRKDLI
ncbi:MAG: hypothetical protein Q4G42_04990 [Neisseria sp.]|nr:hypothetical protein [Neisseria sp.]